MSSAEWIVMGIVAVVVFGFWGWFEYVRSNPAYLAKLQKDWAPKKYHTS